MSVKWFWPIFNLCPRKFLIPVQGFCWLIYPPNTDTNTDTFINLYTITQQAKDTTKCIYTTKIYLYIHTHTHTQIRRIWKSVKCWWLLAKFTVFLAVRIPTWNTASDWSLFLDNDNCCPRATVFAPHQNEGGKVRSRQFRLDFRPIFQTISMARDMLL